MGWVMVRQEDQDAFIFYPFIVVPVNYRFKGKVLQKVLCNDRKFLVAMAGKNNWQEYSKQKCHGFFNNVALKTLNEINLVSRDFHCEQNTTNHTTDDKWDLTTASPKGAECWQDLNQLCDAGGANKPFSQALPVQPSLQQQISSYSLFFKQVPPFKQLSMSPHPLLNISQVEPKYLSGQMHLYVTALTIQKKHQRSYESRNEPSQFDISTHFAIK